MDSVQVTKPYNLTPSQLAALLQPSQTAIPHGSNEIGPLGLTGFFPPHVSMSFPSLFSWERVFRIVLTAPLCGEGIIHLCSFLALLRPP